MGNKHMRIFNRNRPNDVLFLMPVRLADEKLPKSKVRMLYCDADGKVYTLIINKPIYELARDRAERMVDSRKSFATLGLEIRLGKFVPATIEVSTKEAWALEHILEHALKSGRLPDILKKYIKPIIMAGKANREVVLSEYKKSRRRAHVEETPRVLNRLPYYPEHGIEYSMPIYKAEYSYPLIVLKRLLLNEDNIKNTQSLLILDSDGDLAVVKVPYELVENMEKGLTAQAKRDKRDMCAIIVRHAQDMVIDYLPVSQLQRKALETITKYFEETGNGKQPISTAVKTVLVRAKDRLSSSAK